MKRRKAMENTKRFDWTTICSVISVAAILVVAFVGAAWTVSSAIQESSEKTQEEIKENRGLILDGKAAISDLRTTLLVHVKNHNNK